jgi:hypothetical protein
LTSQRRCQLSLAKVPSLIPQILLAERAARIVEESFVVVDAREAFALEEVLMRQDLAPDVCDDFGFGVEPVAAAVETKI